MVMTLYVTVVKQHSQHIMTPTITIYMTVVSSITVVTVVVFVEVALIGELLWSVLTPLSSKWLSTGFTLLVLTTVLSHLFTHVLVFNFQVGDLKNIWLIDSGCSRHMIGDKGWSQVSSQW
jgi:hypothetical protein